MAYEVARVHGLIRSNIHEGEKEAPAETWSLAKSIYQTTPRLSPDTPLCDFPSDSNLWSESSHSSSLESSTETETESDEDDDFIAGLAEQIAHSMLDDDEPANAIVAPGTFHNGYPNETLLHGRPNVVPPKAVSPQSSWSPNSLSPSWSDSVSSSKQSSQVSSPPSTPFRSQGDAWDLLNAAAGEVGRLNISEERKPIQKQVKAPPVPAYPDVVKQCGRVLPQPTAWRTPPHVAQVPKTLNCNAGPRLNDPVSRDRLVAAPAQTPVQKSWSRHRDEDRKVCSSGPPQQRLPRNNEGVNWNQRRSSNPYKGAVNQKAGRQNYGYGQARSTGKPIDNMGLPQRPGQGVNGGSGMRAVFLGSAGSGRESGGTGVFLPRCVGSASEHRRKPSCSTVLLPSRIVQVLNLNVEDMRTHPAPLPVAASHGRNDYSSTQRNPPHMYMMELSSGAMKCDGGNVPSYPRKMPSPHHPQSEPLDYCLPTEWTY